MDGLGWARDNRGQTTFVLCSATFTSAPHVEFAMPTISMFYGIVIYLYFFDDERHKLPHIHAKYHGQDASFSIIDGALLSGDLPHSKVRLVQA